MLGMSATELVIILALALLLLGPDQLPAMAKSLGKGLREIRKATDDLKSSFEQEMVKLEDDAPAPRMIAPLPDQPADPGAARAAARAAALPEDPGAARAAARLAAATASPAATTAATPAATPAVPRLPPPEGAVPRGVARPAEEPKE